MGKTAVCPSCGERFELEDDLEVGDTTFCSACYQELRVISLSPARVEEIKELSDEEEEFDEDSYN